MFTARDVRNITYFIGSVTDRSLSKNSIYVWRSADGSSVISKSGIHYYAEPREESVPYFLLKQLRDGFLDGVTGVYKTPDGYFVDDSEAEAFDSQFPPKEKLKLPGQLV